MFLSVNWKTYKMIKLNKLEIICVNKKIINDN